VWDFSFIDSLELMNELPRLISTVGLVILGLSRLDFIWWKDLRLSLDLRLYSITGMHNGDDGCTSEDFFSRFIAGEIAGL